MKHVIKQLTPPVFADIYRRMRTQRPSEEAPSGWVGNYPTWLQASEASTGYDSAAILERVRSATLSVIRGEAAFERDSVLFHDLEYNWPLVAILLKIAIENENELDLIDFGGALGSSYFQNRAMLRCLRRVQWTVVEQSHFVNCGAREISDEHLGFAHEIGDVLGRRVVPTILLSSVLQYLQDPYALLAEVKERGFRYIVIDRTPVIDGADDRITVQHVPEDIYTASYPSWFFNQDKLLRFMQDGYKLATSFDPCWDPHINLGDYTGVFKGYLFERDRP